MAKSLRSMSEFERKAAIARRLASKTMGLGYWGAFDAQARLTKRALDAAKAAAQNGSSVGNVSQGTPRQ